MRMRTLLSALLLSTTAAIGAESPFVIPAAVREKMPKLLIEMIKKAEEDYKAVLDGRLPRYAKYIEGTFVMDGGSSAYKGDGYWLKVTRKLIKIGDTPGTLYGPTLIFADTTAPNKLSNIEVSDIRFYSRDEYARLTQGKIEEAEQAGAGQPITRPESKSESGDKPQPESEGRSR